MQAQPPSSSTHKAITPPEPGSAYKPSRPLLATAVIGGALIAYLVHKTPDARQRLEEMADMAHILGDLSERDTKVVAELLAKPTVLTHSQGSPRYVF